MISVLRICSSPFHRARRLLAPGARSGQQFLRLVQPGDLLADRFRIIDLLGEGGMGQVYAAEDTLTRTAVAVKVIRPEFFEHPEARARLISELRLARLVTNAHVCRLHDVTETVVQGIQLIFLSMELLDGETLAERLRRQPRLSGEEAKRVALQLAEATAALHEARVVHGDFKPANVMLIESPAGLRAVVTDFGLARSLGRTAGKPDGPVDTSGSSGGTPAYMAPERYGGSPATAASDVFAVGLVVARVLTGLDLHSTVHRSPDGDVSLTVGAEAFLRDLGGEWCRITRRSLRNRPSDRYPTGSDMRAAILKALSPTPRRLSRALLSLAAVLFIATVGFTWSLHWATRPDVAVVPFRNATGDPGLDYVGAGLSESIGLALKRIAGIRVMPSNGGSQHPRLLLQGQLKRRGKQVLVEVDLKNASTGQSEWSRLYERPATELVDLESAIVVDVAPRLSPGANAAVALGTHRPNPRAHDAYLRGLHSLNLTKREDLDKSITWLGEATAQDPRYAPPYAGLARAWQLLLWMGYQSGATILPIVEANAQRALELDPESPEAHHALALVRANSDYDWRRSEAAFRRSLRLDPRSANAHADFALVLLAPMKRPEEAVIEATRALDLAPTDPAIRWRFAITLYLTRNFRILLRVLKDYNVTGIRPDAAIVINTIQALCLDAQDEPKEALAVLRALPVSVATIPGDAPFSRLEWGRQLVLAYTLGRAGQRLEAEKLATEVETGSTGGAFPAVALAAVHNALGHRDRALQLLQRGYEERDLNFSAIGVDARFDSMRSDPRFRALMLKAGLP